MRKGTGGLGGWHTDVRAGGEIGARKLHGNNIRWPARVQAAWDLLNKGGGQVNLLTWLWMFACAFSQVTSVGRL